MDPNQPTAVPGTVTADDFIANLRNPTERDSRPAEPSSAPPPPTPEPKKPDITEAQMVSKVMVNFLDVSVQIACQSIAQEPEEALFKVSESQREQIQKPLAELLDYYKILFNPWWILALAVVGVYSKPVSQAVGIKKKKERVKKAAQIKNPGAVVVEPVVEIKRGPGRPHGTTKEAMAERKNGS